jgi:hypothetical protein
MMLPPFKSGTKKAPCTPVGMREKKMEKVREKKNGEGQQLIC